MNVTINGTLNATTLAECKTFLMGITSDSERSAFAIVMPIAFACCSLALLYNTVQTVRTIQLRARSLKKKYKTPRQKKNAKADTISATLLCMTVSSTAAVFDCIVQASFILTCQSFSSLEAEELWDAITRFQSMVGRSICYGGLILGLILLILCWLDICEATGSMRSTSNGNTSKIAKGLMVLYAASILVVFVLFYGTDMDSIKVAAVAASFVLIYLGGIAWFALRWGKRLSKIIESIDTGSSTKSTLKLIRKLSTEMGYFTLYFLGAVCMLGGGQAAKNGWITTSSLILVFCAQYKVVQSTCKSGTLGASSGSTNSKASRSVAPSAASKCVASADTSTSASSSAE